MRAYRSRDMSFPPGVAAAFRAVGPRHQSPLVSGRPRPRRVVRRAVFALCLLGGTATVTAVSANLGSGPSFAAESIDQYIAVPSYFWPGPDWQRLQGAGSAVSFSIVNPNSGPGTAAVVEVTPSRSDSSGSNRHA